eukprot:c28217_g1_i1 orf=297-3335(+)
MVEAADIVITKARNDRRDYHRLVLQNELQVLLISDPETDKAAAAMNVNVGYFCDPEGLEGLAHFLEHMLFYSSAKYPLENSYMKFLTEHGGHSNAFTSSEHTNFHFDVNADHLEEALDRFAQFFICPLMSADATSREINAVDSENKKNLTVDIWRLNQLFKHTCSKSHPYSKFGTGNLDTLDVRPKARGIDTRKELLEFYERHYSSNLMRLVIYGKETLEKLQSMAEEKFSAIKNRKRSPPEFSGQPCLPENLQVLVKAVPVKEKHSLSLLWPIIPETQNYRKGPSRYLGHLVGHEADGSLFALLKRLGLATSLGAGEMDRSREYAFFSLDIELTDQGQRRFEDILGLTFQYIKVLQEQGIADWIFEEVKAVCDTKFHFQDKVPPFNYVTYLSSNMQLYPPEDWLVGSSLPCNFDADTIKEVLNLLTPETVRIIWASKEFEGKTMEIEPWYGTAYSVEDIADNFAKQLRTAIPDSQLHLPSPNLFIPTDFRLKPLDAKVDHPFLLRNSAMSRLWYKPDSTFLTPKACVRIHFNCSESNCSPEADVLTTIFLKLLVDYLNEYAYFAEIAGLNYSIWQTGTGFQVSVSGYNHKLDVLLQKIIQRIIEFTVKEDRFIIVKEKVLRDCLNFRFQQPYHQALYYSSLLLEHRKWHINDCIEIVPSLKAADLSTFFPRILDRLFLECYVAGNLTSDEAVLLIENTENCLSEGLVKIKPMFASQLMEHRIVKLAPGANYYYPVTGLNQLDENSALHIYLQVGQDETLLNVLLELFILSTKQDIFHQLRSVEQLGYIVALVNRNDFGVRGAQFIIQSSVKDPEELDLRVEAFLTQFECKLHELTDEEFKRNVDALIELKLEKHKNLQEEFRFYWKEIEDGTWKFDRPQLEVATLRNLGKQDLLNFFHNYISMTAVNRSKISVHVYGSLHEENKVASGYEKKQQVGVNEELFSKVQQFPVADRPVQGLINGTITDSEREVRIPENDEKIAQPIRINNIFNFKRSQLLFGSLKEGVKAIYTL